MKASGSAAGLSVFFYGAAFFTFLNQGGWVAWLLVGIGSFFLGVSYVCSVIEKQSES